MARPLSSVEPKVFQETELCQDVSVPFFLRLRLSIQPANSTLQRLMRMTKLIDNNQSLGPRQRQSVLTKLDQHEAKLGDLASKYTVRGSPLLSDSITDNILCIIGCVRQT
jgi:hypothetical protein